jgi:hypothetical protein
MKFSDLDVQSALRVGEVAVDVLDFLATLTGQATEASTFIAVVRSVLHAVEEFKGGKLSADDVRQTITSFKSAIAQDDAAALAALHARFPGSAP